MQDEEQTLTAKCEKFGSMRKAPDGATAYFRFVPLRVDAGVSYLKEARIKDVDHETARMQDEEQTLTESEELGGTREEHEFTDERDA
mmetsp:Transcript_125449/g.362947  ORF Transcript_125449/g.362947 Transcript_125449/m.362947 type:complete len:87 (+) Transcript_125449:311-571(+)